MEIDLELPIHMSAHKITQTDHLGIKFAGCDSFKNMLFRKIL